MIYYTEPVWLDLVLDYFFEINYKTSWTIFNHNKYILYIMDGHPKIAVVIKVTDNNTIYVDFSNFNYKRVIVLDTHTKESILKRLRATTKSLTIE